jgi:5'-deoxynucleotidase YfbR-like HD superfamily hydrolase
VYTIKQSIQFLQEGSRVQRYHTRPGLCPDSDAQHSHGVAVLCWMLSNSISVNLLMAALIHDHGEQGISDVSAHTKRALNLTTQLSKMEDDLCAEFGFDFATSLNEQEKHILKVADIFQGMLHCCTERALGNKFSILIYNRYNKYFNALPMSLSTVAMQIYAVIQELWEEANGPEGPQFDCLTANGK